MGPDVDSLCMFDLERFQTASEAKSVVPRPSQNPSSKSQGRAGNLPDRAPTSQGFVDMESVAKAIGESWKLWGFGAFE